MIKVEKISKSFKDTKVGQLNLQFTISYKTGESMHLPRYEKYPDIEVYYQGEFASIEDKKIYEDYIYRTFYQFYSKCEIKTITQSSLEV